MGLVDLIEREDPRRGCLELAGSHLSGDVLKWNVGQREARVAEVEATEERPIDAAGHAQQWIEVAERLQSAGPTREARGSVSTQHVQ